MGIGSFIDAAFRITDGILIPLAASLCVLYFFWGIAKYLRSSAGDEKAAEEGRNVMVWGIVGLFVLFSIWGLIKFIQSEFGIPDVKVQNSSLPSAREALKPIN